MENKITCPACKGLGWNLGSPATTSTSAKCCTCGGTGYVPYTKPEAHYKPMFSVQYGSAKELAEENATLKKQLEEARAEMKQMEAQLESAHEIRKAAAEEKVRLRAELKKVRGERDKAREIIQEAQYYMRKGTPECRMYAREIDRQKALAAHSEEGSKDE